MDSENIPCPFCAEIIKAEAKLCRFCHAEKIDGNWIKANLPTQTKMNVPKGYFTIQISAWFIIISAMLEIFGAIVETMLSESSSIEAMTLGNHLCYVIFYSTIGYGLIKAKHWSMKLLVAHNIFYTIDKLFYELSNKALESSAVKFIGAEYEGLFASFHMFTTLGMILSWWGFLVFLYFRRSYFGIENASTPKDTLHSSGENL